jgi:hypothetical protein
MGSRSVDPELLIGRALATFNSLQRAFCSSLKSERR